MEITDFIILMVTNKIKEEIKTFESSIDWINENEPQNTQELEENKIKIEKAKKALHYIENAQSGNEISDSTEDETELIILNIVNNGVLFLEAESSEIW